VRVRIAKIYHRTVAMMSRDKAVEAATVSQCSAGSRR
jgi:hypothetical protein